MRAERQGIRRARLAAAVVALVAMLGACDHSPRGSSDRGAASADAVVVASFNFPESELLAEIYAQAIEHAGVPVRREFDLGPRELVQPAQRQGLVDVIAGVPRRGAGQHHSEQGYRLDRSAGRAHRAAPGRGTVGPSSAGTVHGLGSGRIRGDSVHRGSAAFAHAQRSRGGRAAG